ncbi:hypothetical protein ABIC07_007799 [Bradyrhizobium sp. RT9a]
MVKVVALVSGCDEALRPMTEGANHPQWAGCNTYDHTRYISRFHDRRWNYRHHNGLSPRQAWLPGDSLRPLALAVELLETRHVSDAFEAMPVKSDRNDARNIAQLMRLA